jgi:hypothetical protein
VIIHEKVTFNECKYIGQPAKTSENFDITPGKSRYSARSAEILLVEIFKI